MTSCMKVSMAMNPLGDKSVLDDMLSRNAITVSPMFMVLKAPIIASTFFSFLESMRFLAYKRIRF